MRAILVQSSGSPSKGDARFAGDHPDPIPPPGECLIRVRKAGVCATDLQIIKGYMGFAGVLGHEFVGEVVQGPSHLRGQRVVGEINCVCRKCDMCQSGLATHCRRRTVLGIQGRDGCFADLVSLPEANLHEVPDHITDEQAVFVEPIAAACQVLAQCPIDSRMNVSVVGSGRLGLLVAQVLKETGCKLTVIGRNPQKLLLAEKKGIQAIPVHELIPRQDRDVVVDCTGRPEGLEISLSMVRPRGTVVLKSTYADPRPFNPAPIVIHEVTLLGSRCGPFPTAIDALKREAVEVRSMISRTFSLDQGIEALAAAQDPENVKILIDVD